MSRMAAALKSARQQSRTAFIPYITAGDPDSGTSLDLVLMLAQEGADIIELGVPFSDPLADGVTNQRAAERALASGMNLAGVLDLVESIRSRCEVPLVLFTYFNPIFRMGVREFATRAAGVGLDGVLVTDLPPDEGEVYRNELAASGLEPIFMLSPTSSKERVKLVSGATGSFIYYISRAGVTGAREELPAGLREDVARLRLEVNLPVAVGFGVSRREHFQALSGAADAVVVGSALVRLVEAAEGRAEAVEAVRKLVRELLGRDT